MEHVRPNVGEIKQSVGQLLDHPHMNTVIFKAGVIFMSMVQVGWDIDRLHEFTGYSKKHALIPILRRMKEQKIITEENALHVEWIPDEEKEGEDLETMGIAFCMDCMAVARQFSRSLDEEGRICYKLEQPGIDIVEALPS